MKKFLNWISNNIFCIIDIIILIGAPLYATLKSIELSLLDIILLVFFSLQIVFYIIVGLRNRFSYKSYHYNSLKIKTKYECIKKNIVYQRNDNDVLICKRDLKIKALENNLDSILDKFIWTGKSDAKLPIKKENIQEIREQKNRKGVWKFFDIVFPMPLNKGEVLNFSYEWPAISDCSSSSAFVSTSTEVPTKYLEFEIDLGKEYKNQQIILAEYRALDSNWPLSQEIKNFDGNGKYVWKIDKPKRFRYYIARWDWKEQE